MPGAAKLLLPTLLLAAVPSPTLEYVATAHQLGPVGFRDPLGVVSPDGRWLAYALDQHLFLQRVGGDLATELLPAYRYRIFLSWLPDSRRLAVEELSPGTDDPEWLVYEIPGGSHTLLWSQGLTFAGTRQGGRLPATIDTVPASALRHLAWSPDGRWIAGIASRDSGAQLWVFGIDGGNARVWRSDSSLYYPAWTADSRQLGCLMRWGAKRRLSFPCGSAPGAAEPEAYGPAAFSRNGASLYYSTPNNRGTLDLWSRSLKSGRRTQETTFARDTYAPSVTRDGRVLFKTQVFRTVIGTAPAGGGATRALTTFMAESPTWDPTGARIGVTYGNWRRVIDDLHYPDIAQDLGIIRFDTLAPALQPLEVVQASPSEDQGMSWSPNGRWISFHSHQRGSDDIWLKPAAGTAQPRRLTEGGIETGWPRWSPDGKWIAYSTFEDESLSRAVLKLIPVDQESGTADASRTVSFDGRPIDASEVEWMHDSDHLVVGGPDSAQRKAIYLVSRSGGTPRKIIEFDSEQAFSGLGVSPDDRWVAYVGPAADGFFQVFRVPLTGGAPEQVTTDPSNKTHPAWSPDGRQIAFTIWRYDVQFWLLSKTAGTESAGKGRPLR
jgi:TolB protein